MATRSVKITLANNTTFMLTQYQNMLCHGHFLNDSPPPSTVEPNTTVQWESDSDSPSLEGTQGWVKYTCPQGNGQTSELVFIYWQLPFFPPTNNDPHAPLTVLTQVSDVDCNTQSPHSSPYCSVTTPAVWPAPVSGGFGSITAGQATETEVFPVLTAGDPDQLDGLGQADNVVFGVLFALPIVFQNLSTDINLSFGVGLRQKGSIGQSIRHFYDGKKGLRALAVVAHQPSLRKLFAM